MELEVPWVLAECWKLVWRFGLGFAVGACVWRWRSTWAPVAAPVVAAQVEQAAAVVPVSPAPSPIPSEVWGGDEDDALPSLEELEAWNAIWWAPDPGPWSKVGPDIAEELLRSAGFSP